MSKWKCSVCGYIYDSEKGIPEKGIEAGTEFEDLPDDFKCPRCGAGKKLCLNSYRFGQKKLILNYLRRSYYGLCM